MKALVPIATTFFLVIVLFALVDIYGLSGRMAAFGTVLIIGVVGIIYSIKEV